MFSFTKRLNQQALIGAGLVMALWSGSAAAFVVDCGSGGAGIQAAVNAGESFIEVTGTCNETVFIGRDNVTILEQPGAPLPAVVTGGLTVQGATRVFLSNFTINGDNLAGGSGVVIIEGANVRFTNMTLENLHNGVVVIRKAAAFFINSTLGPSLVDDGSVACGPLCALDSGDIRLQGTTVTGNTDAANLGAALAAIRGSSILIRGGNTIINGGTTAAILIGGNSSLRQDDIIGLGTDTITGGGDGVAVRVSGLSFADIRQATVAGDIDVADQSMLRLGNTFFGDPSLLVVNGDVNLERDSGLSVLSPLVTINGDVNCADRESSLAGTFAGGGAIRCTDFNGRRIR